MNFNELSISEFMGFLSSIQQAGKTHSIIIGQKVFIRTITHYYTGRIELVTDSDIVLSDAAWVADTGRFADALQTGNLAEVEPFPEGVSVSRNALVDFCEWKHDLPRKQK